MNDIQKSIIDFLVKKDTAPAFIISSSLKINRRLVDGAIRTLIKKNILEEIRRGINQTRCYRLK